MQKIIRLSPEVIGQIAAGEVVERPAAAIKELIENALDAGATAVTVDIREGGLTCFSVTDNGSGIPASELRMAFERHATSKIRDTKDLWQVATLGFRGEALASIAAVAHVRLTTRTADAETGMQVQNDGGQITSISEAASPLGTSVVVKDLFYNAPVRRKFLKKPAYETAGVTELMARLILSRPDISFRYMADGKNVYFSPGDGQLKNALLSIYGLDVLRMLTQVKGVSGGVIVEGFVGVGDVSRSNRSQEYFFINKRVMKSALLSNAVETACRQRVMIGRFPMCALHLTMPYEQTDVNVHPNKWEIRFQNEAAVRDAVEQAVRTALEESQQDDMLKPRLFA
ncbi:MAG: DNA mismatch repair endonuclease MutL, partial [Clostridia bacterium]|nr:DNA mismatch repair endonuclease MutL [Clostridia bacterium]